MRVKAFCPHCEAVVLCDTEAKQCPSCGADWDYVEVADLGPPPAAAPVIEAVQALDGACEVYCRQCSNSHLLQYNRLPVNCPTCGEKWIYLLAGPQPGVLDDQGDDDEMMESFLETMMAKWVHYKKLRDAANKG